MTLYRVPYELKYARYISVSHIMDVGDAGAVRFAANRAQFLDESQELRISRLADRYANPIDEKSGPVFSAKRYCTFCGTQGVPSEHIEHLMDDASIEDADTETVK